MSDNLEGYKRLAAAIVVQAAHDALKGDASARKWLIEDAPSLIDLAGLTEVETKRIDTVIKSGLTWRQVMAGKAWTHSTNKPREVRG